MNEPSIEMMQSISVDFCLLICSILFFFTVLHAFHLLQVGFLTRGQVTRAVAREFEGNVEITELMAREDFLGHPTKTRNTSWHIKSGACSSTSLCIFMICWSENFEKAGYLTWNAWIWSKTSGRKQLRWDFFCSMNSQLWRFSRCQEALAKPVTPRSRAWSPVFRRSLIVRWFFGFQGRRFRQGCDSNTSSGWRAREPKVRTSLLSIAKVYMTANVVLHLRGNLGINVFQLARL